MENLNGFEIETLLNSKDEKLTLNWETPEEIKEIFENLLKASRKIVGYRRQMTELGQGRAKAEYTFSQIGMDMLVAEQHCQSLNWLLISLNRADNMEEAFLSYIASRRKTLTRELMSGSFMANSTCPFSNISNLAQAKAATEFLKMTE